MNVYDKIDTIFSQESSDMPEWASEILNELYEIKTLLKKEKQVKIYNSQYYDFIKEFRKSMQANIQNNYYPEIEHKGKKIGVNFKGLLYDKESSKLLSTSEAYEVYKKLYENSKNMVKYPNEKVA